MQNLENDYRHLRRLLVSGQITAEDARLWLRNAESNEIAELQKKFDFNIKKFGTNVNREGKHIEQLLGVSDE